MAKDNENLEISKVIQEEGTINVTRTTVYMGKTQDEEHVNTKIAVRPFICQPAYVSVKLGETVPLLQPYASKKIDISISHPCYKEEIPGVLRQVTDFVEEYLTTEISKMEGIAVKRIPKTIKNESAGEKNSAVVDADKKDKKTKASSGKKSSEKTKVTKAVKEDADEELLNLLGESEGDILEEDTEEDDLEGIL